MIDIRSRPRGRCPTPRLRRRGRPRLGRCARSPRRRRNGRPACAERQVRKRRRGLVALLLVLLLTATAAARRLVPGGGPLHLRAGAGRDQPGGGRAGGRPVRARHRVRRGVQRDGAARRGDQHRPGCRQQDRQGRPDRCRRLARAGAASRCRPSSACPGRPRRRRCSRPTWRSARSSRSTATPSGTGWCSARPRRPAPASSGIRPIDLVVSRGPKPIPIKNFVNKPTASAKAALTKAGFTVKITSRALGHDRQGPGDQAGSGLGPGEEGRHGHPDLVARPGAGDRAERPGDGRQGRREVMAARRLQDPGPSAPRSTTSASASWSTPTRRPGRRPPRARRSRCTWSDSRQAPAAYLG